VTRVLERSLKLNVVSQIGSHCREFNEDRGRPRVFPYWNNPWHVGVRRMSGWIDKKK
jgi:hypothetical protein